MTEMPKAPEGVKQKASFNWPVLLSIAVFVAFVGGVWVHNYSVTHAAAAQTMPVTSSK